VSSNLLSVVTLVPRVLIPLSLVSSHRLAPVVTSFRPPIISAAVPIVIILARALVISISVFPVIISPICVGGVSCLCGAQNIATYPSLDYETCFVCDRHLFDLHPCRLASSDPSRGHDPCRPFPSCALAFFRRVWLTSSWSLSRVYSDHMTSPKTYTLF
jgi:hypothetical protein